MSNSVRSAAGLVWRHQRLVWWIFVVNLVLAWLASLPARVTLGAVLNHSLESARLINGFDLGSLVLMLERPDVQPQGLAGSVLASSLIFLVYLLFLDGGAFAVFLDDRKLSRSEFFENCGLFFWRMVRLALYSLVPFAIIMAGRGALGGWADKLSSDAPNELTGFRVRLAVLSVSLLLVLLVRLWFDLAQAWVVRENERKLLRTLWQSLKRMLGAGSLLLSYFGIALFALVCFAAGVALWIRLPHQAMIASFLLLEVVTLTQIAARLWMKAASARWLALQPAETFATAVPVLEVAPLASAPAGIPAEEPAPSHTPEEPPTETAAPEPPAFE